MVQWLGLCTLTDESLNSIPGQGDYKIPQVVWYSQKVKINLKMILKIKGKMCVCVCVYIYTYIKHWITLFYSSRQHNINYTSIKKIFLSKLL